MRLTELKLEYVEKMPKAKAEGILYISKKYNLAVHLCACGCGIEAVTPLDLTKMKGYKDEWALIEDNGKVTLRPSIENFSWEKTYHAHYFITENKIEWL